MKRVFRSSGTCKPIVTQFRRGGQVQTEMSHAIFVALGSSVWELWEVQILGYPFETYMAYDNLQSNCAGRLCRPNFISAVTLYGTESGHFLVWKSFLLVAIYINKTQDFWHRAEHAISFTFYTTMNDFQQCTPTLYLVTNLYFRLGFKNEANVVYICPL
jgi:hypothetical protein